MSLFQLKSEYKPSGDQPQAIDALVKNFAAGAKEQTLLGVTGSGKTFTLANVIAKLDAPVLVLSHNKTLAAQLYSEFKAFFPDNAVEYFISYYDYYLPESYIPATDTYIAKDASINENIEKLRLASTANLLERRDTIVIASVSCIYGLGSPEDYANMCVTISAGEEVDRDDFLRRLIDIQYERNDTAPAAGQFRVKGDTIEVFEPQRDDFIRISFWGDEIEAISRHDMVSGHVKTRPAAITFYPCKHFVLPAKRIEEACETILKEMHEQVNFFEKQGLLVEAQRIYQRVTSDMEMLKEFGYASGIENYSRHLAKRSPGSRPPCLLDFFPDDYLTIIDESHVTIPQINAMFKADRNRKQTLIDHGFRLPSALDNRPLKFEEFEALTKRMIYVSATPGNYELERTGKPVEQIIRPTGLLDPKIEIRPLEGQVDDVAAEIRNCAKRKERVLVTTMTKKSAERLSDYLNELELRVSYLHSEMDALERVKVLSKLSEGEFDCLIGINLLREGIDLPSVTLVAILDADKEGFLRSARSLIQVAGRAARNARGRVILYGEKITPAMQELLDVTENHRKKQIAYNQAHNIVPKTIEKSRRETISDVVKSNSDRHAASEAAASVFGSNSGGGNGRIEVKNLSEKELSQLVYDLEVEMLAAAESLEFERAAKLRDKLNTLTDNRFVQNFKNKR